MKTSKFFNCALTLIFGLLISSGTIVRAGEIRGSSGNNFTLTPTATPGVFHMTHPGVAQVSLLGNCTFDGDEIVIAPAGPNDVFVLSGTWHFATADGSSTLDTEVEGIGTPDPTNPNFVNVHYTFTFTGGTGLMANARGKGELDGVAMLTSPNGGTTTFTFTGQVSTHGQKKP
jgi:hypothetical protein